MAAAPAGGDGADLLFSLCLIAFVPSRSLPSKSIAELTTTVKKYGADVLEPDEHGRITVSQATHIISNTIDFEEYTEAMAMMVPVVTSHWITNSLSRNKQAQIRPFSPDPRMIFHNVNLTCADIPTVDKEVITGATLALGGMESKDLSRLTTHICALSMDHPKCQQAELKKLKCKIVLPHWFDDCFKLGKKIDEKPYLLPDPEILRGESKVDVAIPPSEHLEGATTALPDGPPSMLPGTRQKLTVFRKKKVLLSWDLSISSRFRDIVTELVKSGEGDIVRDVDECDMFICQYRDGEQYIRAAQQGKDVGNLAWLFYLITHDEWCSPLRRLLHYPVPRDGIPGFKDMKITLSNYGGEARIYLENLVTAAGATYTKTMKSDNTHLITARDNSEKCQAARDWNIHMVNHLWIEESYAKCEAQTLSNPKYSHFPPRTHLGEVIGQIFFDESRLRNLYYPGGDDSLGNKGKRKRKILEAAQENAYSTGPAAGMVVGRQEHQEVDVMRDDDAEYAEKTTSIFGVPAPPRDKQNLVTPAKGRHVRSGKENDTPTVMSSGSRSAKDKALSKLHNLAPDIALYEKEKKRSTKDGHAPWGGKRAADQYEKAQAAAKSSSPAPQGDEEEEEEEEEEDVDAQRPSKKQKTGLPAVEMRVVLTGFQRWVGHSAKEEHERKKLRNMGIQIVQDNQPCDYLAAPFIVRTMKFLKVLARGPDVISSKFIEAALDSGKVPPIKKYLLKDEENEEKFDFDLQKSIARARANKGRLLWNVPIYCTAEIKNGYESYKAIAEANSAIFKLYRARSGTTIKPTTAEEDGGAPPEPVYLLSCPSPAERQLWPRFEQMARQGNMEPRVVAPDWLLDVAMRQEITFDEKYLCKNFWS